MLITKRLHNSISLVIEKLRPLQEAMCDDQLETYSGELQDIIEQLEYLNVSLLNVSRENA